MTDGFTQSSIDIMKELIKLGYHSYVQFIEPLAQPTASNQQSRRQRPRERVTTSNQASIRPTTASTTTSSNQQLIHQMMQQMSQLQQNQQQLNFRNAQLLQALMQRQQQPQPNLFAQQTQQLPRQGMLSNLPGSNTNIFDLDDDL